MIAVERANMIDIPRESLDSSTRRRRSPLWSRLQEGVSDVLLVLLLVFAFPLVIVLLGLPLALVLRTIVEIAQRF